ncbi:WYL domain-containing protein [Dactylosporangium salmoneum]
MAAGPVVPAEVLTVIAQACRDKERLRFRDTARGDPDTEREVEPHRLVALGGRWYLVAPDAAEQVWQNVYQGVALAERTGSAALADTVRTAFVAGVDASLLFSIGTAVAGIAIVLAFRLTPARDRR